MNRLDVGAVLESLARHRPVFHSEADFQHAFAWELQKLDSTVRIRLEKRAAIKFHGSPMHMDIIMASPAGEVVIELKYKTRKLALIHEGECFELLNQSAQDIARYDFIKDISRLEHYVARNPEATGYAILLTNDPGYWMQTAKAEAVDAAFRIHESREISGHLDWRGASEGTKKGRTDPFDINGRYRVIWKDFSEIGAQSEHQFRYTAIQVQPAATLQLSEGP